MRGVACAPAGFASVRGEASNRSPEHNGWAGRPETRLGKSWRRCDTVATNRGDDNFSAARANSVCFCFTPRRAYFSSFNGPPNWTPPRGGGGRYQRFRGCSMPDQTRPAEPPNPLPVPRHSALVQTGHAESNPSGLRTVFHSCAIPRQQHLNWASSTPRGRQSFTHRRKALPLARTPHLTHPPPTAPSRAGGYGATIASVS